MWSLGVEVKDLQSLGLVSQFFQSQYIAMHGGRVTGHVDNASGVPGDNHIRDLLIQSHTWRIHDYSIHGDGSGIPLLYRGCEERGLFQMHAGKGKAEFVDFHCGLFWSTEVVTAAVTFKPPLTAVIRY